MDGYTMTKKVVGVFVRFHYAASANAEITVQTPKDRRTSGNHFVKGN
jgi:hypothetical protein